MSGPKCDVLIIILSVFCFHTRTPVFSRMNSLEELRISVSIRIAVRIWIALGIR